MHKLGFFRGLVVLAALVPAVSFSFAQGPGQSKTYRLQPRRAAGALDRVEAALEVTGNNKVVREDKEQLFKMSVLANVTYDEKLLDFSTAADQPMRSVRRYDKASVLLKLGNDELRPTLRDDRRLVSIQIDGPSIVLFAPHGPLTRDELDLLEMHGTSASLLAYRLLPDEPVAKDDTWKPSSDLMAAMLDLDAVSQTDVQCVLIKVVDDTAQVELTGKVQGAVGGVATEIELRARYHFDISAGRITWFGLVTQESRAVGHVGPGLEALSRLQMKFTPIENSEPLSESALADVELVPTDELTRLSHQSSEGGWRFVYDRRWHITHDEDRLAIMRMIHRGEFVAQCKVHALDDAPLERQADLSEFQADIRRGLGDTFKQFVNAAERPGPADCRIYRVVAAGEVEELPIQWIYYLITDKHGRQVVASFSVEGDLLKQFDEADVDLIASLRLDAPQVAAKPTLASEPTKAEK